MSNSQSLPSSPTKSVSAPPTRRIATTDLPIPQASLLHLPLMSPLNLPHIPRPKLTRRHTEPPTLKIQCSSGASRRTHSTLSTCTNQRRGTIEHRDVYVCSDAVNAPRLVSLTREAMDQKVQSWGGNAMVDESWSYTIRQRKSSHGQYFKVSVTYKGVVAQCDRPDPHFPVALEEAKSVPGLMTVLSRT